MKLFSVTAFICYLYTPTNNVAKKNRETVNGEVKNDLYTYAKPDDYKIFPDDIAQENSEKPDKKLRKDYN